MDTAHPRCYSQHQPSRQYTGRVLAAHLDFRHWSHRWCSHCGTGHYSRNRLDRMVRCRLSSQARRSSPPRKRNTRPGRGRSVEHSGSIQESLGQDSHPHQQGRDIVDRTCPGRSRCRRSRSRLLDQSLGRHRHQGSLARQIRHTHSSPLQLVHSSRCKLANSRPCKSDSHGHPNQLRTHRLR
jgi:hypothetical protein